MAKKTNMSESFSFKGWNYKEFFKGYFSIFSKIIKLNSGAIKEGAKFIVPFILAKLTVQYPGAEYAITIIGKGALDILEFYVKKVELTK